MFEGRDHIGGNCYTEVDRATGVTVHLYGPHIFHTPHERVWRYVTHFSHFMPYRHRVMATVRDQVYSLPINLLTINQALRRGVPMNPAEAKRYLEIIATGPAEPVTFEDQGLRFVGRELYEMFFAGYTAKQWGVDPKDLPASVLKRLPVRFNFDDSYFDHRYQGMPEHGYTPIFERLLDSPNIDVHLGRPMRRDMADHFDHTLWTGPIDGFFDHQLGRLGYRTLDFEVSRHDGDFQGCPVMNYCDRDVRWTRSTEFKHFAPWEQHDRTVVYHEEARACGHDDIPYYPVRLVRDQAVLQRYEAEARGTKDVSFVGRLGTYRYLDMDACVAEALNASDRLLEGERPTFFTEAP